MTNKEITLAADVPFLPERTLRSGNITLMYEAGKIRYIKYGNNEVLRMIYPALRDETWKTIPAIMQNEHVEVNADGFLITYTNVYDSGAIKYTADFEIKGNGNTIEYIMNGKAQSGFKSKRVGLCVHHPIEPCAGRELKIGHPGGKESRYIFPVMISPHWPFTDIQSMHWNTVSESVELDFHGDLFETEDQRNWTDDSYKTYSGPQHAVKMIDIKTGDTMQHRIKLSVSDLKIPFPKIGYSRQEKQPRLSDKGIDLFKKIPFDHYRIALHLVNEDWKNVLMNAAEEAKQLGTRLELAVFFTSADDAEELLKELNTVSPLLDSLLILSADHPIAPHELYRVIRQKIKAILPGLKTGYGSSSWFAELNRALPEGLEYDFVSFLVSPQVHQTDSRSILENLGSQHATIDTLRNKLGDTPIHVSPVFLNSRADDERLHSSFAAWWTISAICNFAKAGHITFYELEGKKGVIKNEEALSPLYNILKTIKDFSPAYIIKKNDRIVLENVSGQQLDFTFKQSH